jgi:FkbM family methyltransferase
MHPLCVRLGSSDISVFNQIFIEREYGPLDDMGDGGLIIDCGANVGYSSAYFLSRYPNCQVVAVEAEPGNHAVLEMNLAAYGGRAKVIHAGVWSRNAPLAIQREKYRDGREWSKQVRLCGPGEESDVEGVGVGSLLAASGFESISLLKMDIEGAEAVVFSDACQSWLGKVEAIAIELHDDSIYGNASEVFFSAIRQHGFGVSRSGELTICRRLEAP